MAKDSRPKTKPKKGPAAKRSAGGASRSPGGRASGIARGATLSGLRGMQGGGQAMPQQGFGPGGFGAGIGGGPQIGGNYGNYMPMQRPGMHMGGGFQTPGMHVGGGSFQRPMGGQQFGQMAQPHMGYPGAMQGQGQVPMQRMPQMGGGSPGMFGGGGLQQQPMGQGPMPGMGQPWRPPYPTAGGGGMI
jgi:hypothetical protein